MVVYDPRGQTWDRWCPLMVELFQQQHIGPYPEDEWQQFGLKLMGSGSINRASIPNPIAYVNWQEWASALVGVISPSKKK